VLLNMLIPGVCPVHTTEAPIPDAGEGSAEAIDTAVVAQQKANETKRSYVKEDYWTSFTSLEVPWRQNLYRQSGVFLNETHVSES
jgi:hypothetical protein